MSGQLAIRRTMADTFERDLRRAEKELSRRDPVLGRLIKKAGPCRLEKATHFEPFESLMSSIAHQQLTGKAAETILGRLKAKLGDGEWPTAKKLAATRLPSLRSCGFSRAKGLALKDLAAKTLDGTVPTAKQLHDMPEDAIVERLTEVRGIGRWTVEMMLMFRLGRLDVLPVDDFGVRKGYSLLYRKKEMVKPKELLALGEPWRPFRSVASWYMWRALE